VPATKPGGELRIKATALIIEKLKSISVSQAARDLKVSRQAIYGFKDGTYCPSLAVIQRACSEWKLEFSFRGMQVSRDSFKPKKRRRGEQSAEQPAQLTFFDLWDQLKDQRMTVVRARHVDGAVEMTLLISIPA
jgi:predicted transcriptional regulator